MPMMTMSSPRHPNVAALLAPAVLLPDTLDPLLRAKELYWAEGYETAKVFASCHYVWPSFAAWLRRVEAPKEMRRRLRSVGRTSDARQGEFAFTDGLVA